MAFDLFADDFLALFVFLVSFLVANKMGGVVSKVGVASNHPITKAKRAFLYLPDRGHAMKLNPGVRPGGMHQ